MTDTPETFDGWRERTAAQSRDRAAVNPLSAQQDLRIGLALVVATIPLLVMGATPFAWLTAVIALGVLLQAAALTWVPAPYRELADALGLIVAVVLGTSFLLVLEHDDGSGWIGLGSGATLLTLLKYWGWRARR